MAICSQLSICCLLLSVASSTQRVCRSVTTGPAAVCEATLGSNWTIVCSVAHQQNRTIVSWKLPGGSYAQYNAALILTNVSHEDAGEYSCAVNLNGTEHSSSLKLFVGQGRPPALLHDNNYQQMGAVGANCQVVQVVSNAVLPAMVTGYPMPAVMWFKDVRRTNRITNDSIYQLLPTGDLFIKDLLEDKEETKQLGQNVLYVMAANEFGIKRYCIHIQWNDHSNVQHYRAVKPTKVEGLVYSSLKYHCNHSGCFCKASCPTHNFQQWHLILLGLCLGYVFLLSFIILIAVLFHQLRCYQYYHRCVQIDNESDGAREADTMTKPSTDSGEFVYVVYSPQSEQWVEHTLMYKLSQWQQRYTTYDLSAIPGQPKIVEKLRLCSAANKIIIVLAVDSLTEYSFLNEVLQIISNEQAKVIPVLYGVSEEELEKDMIYRNIMVYVSIHHTDVNFDIRLKQALS